jgi:hypothetical protein
LLLDPASEITSSSAWRIRVEGFVCLLFATARKRAFSSFETLIESVSVINQQGSPFVSKDNYQSD